MGAIDWIALMVVAAIMVCVGYLVLVEISPALDILKRDRLVVSSIDKEPYIVEEEFANSERAANVLARINRMNVKLIKHLKANCMDGPYAENIELLRQNYNPTVLGEHIPHNLKYTSYTTDKGKKMRFCLRPPQNRNGLYDWNTLAFVDIHELAHVATKSTGHQHDFWEVFRFLLVEANRIGEIKLIDYKKQPVPYCGIMIESNPVFDRP